MHMKELKIHKIQALTYWIGYVDTMLWNSRWYWNYGEFILLSKHGKALKKITKKEKRIIKFNTLHDVSFLLLPFS